MAVSDMPRWDVYPIKNRARGRLPVASIFDVNPTNLANATDGDFNTVTGTGNKTIVGVATLGRVAIDLGGIYNVHLRVKCGLWSTAGTVDAYSWGSTDNVTYYRISWKSLLQVIGQIAEYIIHNQIEFVRARYLYMDFVGQAAMTGYVKIYEIQAIDLGI